MSHSQQKDALRWRLRLIFLYYASYADRNNYKLLKSQNYRRFLIDCQAVTDQAAFPPFDIAFRKIHSTAIKLQQFQDLLPVISQLVYNHKKRKEAFQMFISNHMEKLYSQILAHSQYGADFIAIQRLVIEKHTLEMLDTPAVHKAYQKYIESTSMHQKEPQHTFQQVHLFLSDFQVSPKLVYKAMVYLVFFQQLTISHTNSWGIQDFKKLLICIAQLCWRRSENEAATQETKLLRLLQHMEVSEGFKRMVDKTLKQNALLISFFKFPVRLMNQLRESREKLSSSRQGREPQSTKHLEGSRYFSAKRERHTDLNTIKSLLDEGGDLVNRLRQIFERLCSFGQVGNTQTLKSIKIKKYFKGLNILAPLEQTWLDITITDLCRDSVSGKVEFPQFLQLLQLAATKLNVGWEGLFHYLTDHSLAEMSSSRAYFSQKNQSIPQDNRSIEILLHIQKQLEKIYNHYKGGKKALSFQQLTHLLFEFEIFPTFIAKTKLYSHFQNRAKATNQVRKLAGEIALDMRGFLQVISDVSLQIGEQLQKEQRVLFILERMQDSQGHRKILGSQGSNLIGDLRDRFSFIYKRNLQRNSPAKQEGFEELLEGYNCQ